MSWMFQFDGEEFPKFSFIKNCPLQQYRYVLYLCIGPVCFLAPSSDGSLGMWKYRDYPSGPTNCDEQACQGA